MKLRNHALFDFPAMIIASALALALAAPVFGQQAATATIEGIVTDPNKAAVPGAKVTVKNRDTGLTREITTDDSGIYRIAALPPLARKPSEYVRGPRYFQSIQLHEGEQSLRHAIEALGEDTLMFATDYPHSESWFPKSVEVVLGWRSISETARRKLLWDNAARCYPRLNARRPSSIPDPLRTSG